MTHRKRMRSARSEAMFATIRRTFLEQGYLKLTMGELAAACGLTRRALYHHFSSKEEAFRAQLVWQHMREVDGAVAAASRSATDAIVEAMDARYGQTQRELASSAMGGEYSDQVARYCGDIVSGTSAAFQVRIANLLRELEARGHLEMKGNMGAVHIAELLTDAICGVTAQLPHVAAEELRVRYRRMCAALLFGSVAGLPCDAERLEPVAETTSIEHSFA